MEGKMKAILIIGIMLAIFAALNVMAEGRID